MSIKSVNIPRDLIFAIKIIEDYYHNYNRPMPKYLFEEMIKTSGYKLHRVKCLIGRYKNDIPIKVTDDGDGYVFFGSYKVKREYVHKACIQVYTFIVGFLLCNLGLLLV